MSDLNGRSKENPQLFYTQLQISDSFMCWWNCLSHARLRSLKQETSRDCNTSITCGGNLKLLYFPQVLFWWLVSIYVLGDRQVIGAMVFLWQYPQNSWTKQQIFCFHPTLNHKNYFNTFLLGIFKILKHSMETVMQRCFQCWRLETSSRLFYDFIKMTI